MDIVTFVFYDKRFRSVKKSLHRDVFFCIYKISYQVLFGFTIEYVLVRKQFFYEKVSKYHFLAERRDKLLIYNKIEE